MPTIADYSEHLDEETRAFVEHTDRWYPSDAAERPIAEQRALYDAMCREYHSGHPPGVIAHHVRGDAVETAGQVLIYPGLGGDTSRGSYVTHANAPMLTTRDVDFYTSIRGWHVDRNDPTAAPLRDTDFGDLPPTVIITAACDPLSDDGRDYLEHVRRDVGPCHRRAAAAARTAAS